MEGLTDQDTTATEMTVRSRGPALPWRGGGHLGKQWGQQEAEVAMGKHG